MYHKIVYVILNITMKDTHRNKNKRKRNLQKVTQSQNQRCFPSNYKLKKTKKNVVNKINVEM